MPATAKSQSSRKTRCSGVANKLQRQTMRGAGVADKLQRLIAEAEAVLQQGEPTFPRAA
jgi:hypothetical protein